MSWHRQDGTNCGECGQRDAICAALLGAAGTPCCGECGHGRLWPGLDLAAVPTE